MEERELEQEIVRMELLEELDVMEELIKQL